MTELEIKEVINEITNLLNEVGQLSDEFKESFISRMTDVLNHIDAHYMAHQAEIDCIKIRLGAVENNITIMKNKKRWWSLPFLRRR